MSEWFMAGLWGGLGYMLSGVLTLTAILSVILFYVAIRWALDWLGIKRWKI